MLVRPGLHLITILEFDVIINKQKQERIVSQTRVLKITSTH